jgi:hypothetical protein
MGSWKDRKLTKEQFDYYIEQHFSEAIRRVIGADAWSSKRRAIAREAKEYVKIMHRLIQVKELENLDDK